jgi:serine/threonine protein kinase
VSYPGSTSTLELSQLNQDFHPRHPFHGPTHYDTLRNMVTKQPTIDPKLTAEAAELIRQLLVNNPRNRLCSKRGISELKSMAFFQYCDWEGLYAKTLPMPFSPTLKSSTDVSSFESLFTNEEPVDSIAKETKVKDQSTRGKGFFGLFGFGFSTKGDAKAEAAKNADEEFVGFVFTREDAAGHTAALKAPGVGTMEDLG